MSTANDLTPEELAAYNGRVKAEIAAMSPDEKRLLKGDLLDLRHAALDLAYEAIEQRSAEFDKRLSEVEKPPETATLEARIAARPAPKVTPADIEAEIAEAVYINPGDYLRQGHPASVLTICILTLRNGFVVTGESACASPENFDAQIGREVARKAAVDKCWSLLGFRLRDQLANAKLKPAENPIEIIRTTTMLDPNDFGNIVTYEAKKGSKTASARLRTCKFTSAAAMQNEAFRLLHEEFARQDDDRQQDA